MRLLSIGGVVQEKHGFGETPKTGFLAIGGHYMSVYCSFTIRVSCRYPWASILLLKPDVSLL